MEGLVKLSNTEPKINRRIGSFRVSEEMVRHHAREVMKVMAECLVVRCELRYDTMTFDYVAISPHFAEVKEGQYPPQYEARMEQVNMGTSEEPNYVSRFLGFFPVE